MTVRLFARVLASAALGLALGACASAPPAASGQGGAVTTWRMLSQVEQRFAIFVDEPGAPKVGDLATFRLAYVYMPGQVMFEEREVGWQEYSAMTVNCGANEVRTGPRKRYGPDGSLMASDDNQDFAPINPGTSVETAANIRCRGVAATGFAVKDGPNWREAARKHIAETPPAP